MTYLDGLYDALSRRNRSGDDEDSISKIRNFLENEDFDSDALREDVYGVNEICSKGSNISKVVNDKTQFKAIQDYIEIFNVCHLFYIHIVYI